MIKILALSYILTLVVKFFIFCFWDNFKHYSRGSKMFVEWLEGKVSSSKCDSWEFPVHVAKSMQCSSVGALLDINIFRWYHLYRTYTIIFPRPDPFSERHTVIENDLYIACLCWCYKATSNLTHWSRISDSTSIELNTCLLRLTGLLVYFWWIITSSSCSVAIHCPEALQLWHFSPWLFQSLVPISLHYFTT